MKTLAVMAFSLLAFTGVPKTYADEMTIGNSIDALELEAELAKHLAKLAIEAANRSAYRLSEAKSKHKEGEDYLYSNFVENVGVVPELPCIMMKCSDGDDCTTRCTPLPQLCDIAPELCPTSGQ